MDWIWSTTIALAITFLFLLHQWHNPSKNKKKPPLPPGPKGLPIIGHFHLLGKNPHQDLFHLSRKHGPIMYTRFGSIPTIIVSSPSAAALFLKTHDLTFADRPHHEAAFHLGYEQRNLVFAPYGPYWGNMRKLCALDLLSGPKVAHFQATRAAEVASMVASLSEATMAVDMGVRVAAVIADMISLMVFGGKFAEWELDGARFKEVMTEAVAEGAAFNLGDYFPRLRWMDLQGSARRLKKLSGIFDRFLERIIDEHVGRKERSLDFVDTIMGILESGEAGFEFDRRHVKAVLLVTFRRCKLHPSSPIN